MLRIYLYVPLTQFTQFICVNNEVLKNCKALYLDKSTILLIILKNNYYLICHILLSAVSYVIRKALPSVIVGKCATTEMNFKLKCETKFSPINKIDLFGNEFENRSRIVCPSSILSIPEEKKESSLIHTIFVQIAFHFRCLKVPFPAVFHSMIDSADRGYRFGFSKPATPHRLGRW
ncbi:hypothetical protein T08_12789 [Trichinella sp. T8]|nr:hypothetical protein T08_12789 [Trichinella sp. T8]